MLRRDFLKMAVQSSLLYLPFSHPVFAAQGQTRNDNPPRLIVIFLRGAVDGLSIVTPYTENEYYSQRSTIALPRPSAEDGLLDLDGHFGLHPALSALMPLWQSGKLGFVQASGSPDKNRSHFDAQDYMESGTPGVKSTADGWLNRMLGVLYSDTRDSTLTSQALSMGPVLPRIYAGHNTVMTVPLGAAAGKPNLLDKPRIADAFEQLYNNNDALSRAYQEAQKTHQEVLQSFSTEDMSREMQAANNGAPLPNGFPDDATRLAILMRSNPRIQLAFMALGGWDTHANQGASKGQLANRLEPLGQGLATLSSGLGPVLDNTVIVVMSEFGRTVHQNGNKGTDHGHGNVMWLLGGNIHGTKVHGDWPSLNSSALYEGRDLAITTDFRQVLAQLAERHLKLSDAQLNAVFPAFSTGNTTLNLMRS